MPLSKMSSGDDKFHEDVDEVNHDLNNLKLEENTTIKDDDFIDEVALKDAQTDLSDDELNRLLMEALERKESGNVLFREGQFTQARAEYTAALKICPLVNLKERSVLFSNRGACNMKEDRKAEAIADCSEAVQLDPTYLKPLKRRAVLYEETDKLDESLEDFKKVLELDQYDQQARQAVQNLPGKIHERNEKLKEQMMGTLKDLGNRILRPFGMSTDNFQLQQDPNSGSYSINFKS